MSLEAMNIIAVLLQYAGLIVLLRGVLGYPFRGKKFVAAACAGLGILLHLGDWMWSWQMVEIIPDYYVHIGAWLHMLASAMAEYALFSQLSVSAFVLFFVINRTVLDTFFIISTYVISIPDEFHALTAASMTVCFFLLFAALFWKKKERLSMYLKKIHGWMYWILAIVLYFAKQYHASLGNIRWLAVQSEVFNRINHSIISLLLAGFIMGLLILIAQRKKLEEKDRLNQRLLKMQTEQWKRQNESQKELRAFRHDFSAHVQALDILSKQKDYEKLNAYIQKFGEIRESVFYISTNHIIGDAIVNEYYRRGREDGTAVTVVGRFPDEMKISDMDLCILLSNLMSNAWKAAQEACGERQIQMKIGAYDEKVFITVWNPVNSAPVIVDGMIQRPERKEDGHGFGIENMKKALTPYGGMIRWEVDDEETNGIFVITKVIF